MAVFNKRRRDSKGAGKIRLDGDGSTGKTTSNAKTGKMVMIGGAVVVGISLAVVFGMMSGGDTEDHASSGSSIAIAQPAKPIPSAPVTKTPTAPVKIQSIREKVSEKTRTIYNRSGCLYESFVSVKGNEVAAGSDFGYFTCLQNDGEMAGGISMLLAEGPWAGTRIGFFPRKNGGRGLVLVQKAGEQVVGADGQTKEFYRLPDHQHLSDQSFMSNSGRSGNDVIVSRGEEQFVKTIRRGSQTRDVFVISGDPFQGRFKIELPNGDIFKINLNNGDFTADSLFLNCSTYRYGQESNCPRTNFKSVTGNLSKVPSFQRQ